MMHAPSHADVLPDHVSPELKPDTRSEARLLLLCLETGYVPTYEKENEEEGLGLSEIEVMARGG